MTPLSIEKLSRGRPAMFHACMCTGSPRIRVIENSPDMGRFLLCNQNKTLIV